MPRGKEPHIFELVPISWVACAYGGHSFPRRDEKVESIIVRPGIAKLRFPCYCCPAVRWELRSTRAPYSRTARPTYDYPGDPGRQYCLLKRTTSQSEREARLYFWLDES